MEALKVIDLYHVREELLTPGDLIQPGRWGDHVRATGVSHPFHSREMLGETRRALFPNARVSRSCCTYAFEDLGYVVNVYREAHHHLYRVVPVDEAAPRFRGDMLWLTWMGEPGAAPEENVGRWDSYWRGESAADRSPRATSTWEWLFACALVVVEVL